MKEFTFALGFGFLAAAAGVVVWLMAQTGHKPVRRIRHAAAWVALIAVLIALTTYFFQVSAGMGEVSTLG